MRPSTSIRLLRPVQQKETAPDPHPCRARVFPSGGWSIGRRKPRCRLVFWPEIGQSTGHRTENSQSPLDRSFPAIPRRQSINPPVCERASKEIPSEDDSRSARRHAQFHAEVRFSTNPSVLCLQNLAAKACV